MPALRLTVAVDKLPFSVPFRITGYVFEHQDAVVVTLDDGRHQGRGEAQGVFYLNDNADGMVAAIERQRAAIERGIDRATLQRLMPPGGARNAVDCALWELEASRAGQPAWKLAGLAPPKPLLCTFTLGAEPPAVMAEGARRYADAPALKVKLTGEPGLDRERVQAIRAVRPDAWIGVDANQGYTIDKLPALVDMLLEASVSQLEQPLARGREEDLEGFRSPIPIYADESALSLDEVAALVGRFDGVNIKLDKAGGLTEGLAMAREAHRLGLKLMVGNMMGSSLAMAPAFLIGQLCDVVDLDGPTFLARDRTPSVTYTRGMIWCDEAVWGSGRASG